MKALILDDELYCVEYLEAILQKYCPEISTIIIFTEPEKALYYLIDNTVDLLFLDVEMPSLNGFDLLAKLPKNNTFSLIFTTAYDKYALQAFRYGAIDYLLKPISIQELVETMARVKTRNSPTSQQQIDLLHSVQKETIPQKIALSTSDGLHIVKTNEILYCNSDGCYTRFFFENGTNILVSKPIKEVGEILNTLPFFRIHHSYLINIEKVKKYLRGEGGEVIMQNDDVLPVSRNQKKEFMAYFVKL